MSEIQDNQSKALDGEQSLLLDHDYDGIRELDHPLPRWWIYTFYATIVFAGLYVGYYMMGPGLSLRAELDLAMTELNLKRPKEVPIVMDEEPKKETNVDHVKLGGGLFVTRCAPCHGAQGQGGIGPNLTDTYWLHGKGSAQDIAKIVQTGVTEKGMPAWNDVLKPEEIKDVVLFLKSLQGTNPPNPKAPQGEKI